MQWVELLPDTQTPSWLGLPNNAERVLLTTQGGYPTHPAPWEPLPCLRTTPLWEVAFLPPALPAVPAGVSYAV